MFQKSSKMSTDPEKAAADTPAAAEEEVSEEEMEEDDGDQRKELVEKLMKDPQVLAALQTKLRRFLGSPSGYISVSVLFCTLYLF